MAVKDITVVVNGRPRTVSKKEQLAFEEVVELAYPGEPQTETRIYSVTYSKGEEGKEGELVAGGAPVKVKKDMVFNVTRTNRS